MLASDVGLELCSTRKLLIAVVATVQQRGVLVGEVLAQGGIVMILVGHSAPAGACDLIPHTHNEA